MICSKWITLTWLTILWISKIFWCKSITKEARFTFLTIEPSCIIDTLETFSGCSVAVSNSAHINVSWAFTFSTFASGSSMETFRITKVSILTEFTTGPDSTFGTLRTKRTVRMAFNLVAFSGPKNTGCKKIQNIRKMLKQNIKILYGSVDLWKLLTQYCDLSNLQITCPTQVDLQVQLLCINPCLTAYLMEELSMEWQLCSK